MIIVCNTAAFSLLGRVLCQRRTCQIFLSASSHHTYSKCSLLVVFNRSMYWLAWFWLLLITSQACQAGFGQTPKSDVTRQDFSKDWNPHVINNASCPKFVLAELGTEGMGDQLEHYLYSLNLAKLLDATLVVDGFVSGALFSSRGHSGFSVYRWVAERLLGINMEWNATYVSSVYQPTTISLKYDDVTAAKSKEIAGGPTTSSLLLPCNTMATSSIWDCGSWCHLKRPFVGFTELGWILRQNQGYEKCHLLFSKKKLAGTSNSTTAESTNVIVVVSHQHTL